MDSAGKAFRANSPFTGVPWLERPEKRAPLPRTSHVHRTQRDSESNCLLPYGGEAIFVGICAPSQYDRVACLAMEYGIGLSAACQEQYHGKHKTSRHPGCPSMAGKAVIVMCPLLHTRKRYHCERNFIFDETTQANLVLTGHLNKFYTKPTPFTPTDLG